MMRAHEIERNIGWIGEESMKTKKPTQLLCGFLRMLYPL